MVIITFKFRKYGNWLFYLMQHVTAEGTALVKQAEDAASNKKVNMLVLGTCIFYLNML